MLKRSTDLSRWLLLAGLLCCSSCQSVSSSFENKTGQNDSRSRIFSPRMDYDEWTPLGRGDPLKNNPTFDYVPPVLDKVQYWLDSHTTEASSKRDILVLGVTAKKTSPKIPEQFLKFVDGPKFTRTGQDTSYRNDFTGSTGAEPPKVLRTTSFRNGLIDYRNQNRIQSLPASYYPSAYYNQKMKPYTMMMPPPMIQKPAAETSTNFNIAVPKEKLIGHSDTSQPFSTQTEEGPLLQDTQYYGVSSKEYGHYSPAPSARPYSTSKAPSNKGVGVSQIETIKSIYTPPVSQSMRSRYEATTAPSVSFEKSNLIYQSTQTLSGGWLGNNGPVSSSTELPDINQITWQTSDYSRDRYEIDNHAAASSNHEVVVGQNANIIVENNSNEEIVIGQKEVSTDATSSSSESIEQTSTASFTTTETTDREDESVTNSEPSQKMHIVVANSPSTVMDSEMQKTKKGPVAVVMPTNYMEKNSSSNADPPTTHYNAWEKPMVSEMTKTAHQTSNAQSQPLKSMVTNAPILTDQSSAASSPNKITPASQRLHQFSHPSSVPVVPPRHINSPPHMFFPPQSASQSIMRPPSRPNYTMMQFIGSMRPGFRPSSPMSMSHMSPPMAHIHMPLNKEQDQRPAQSFPVTFSSSPSSSTSSVQTTASAKQSTDHRPSRLPASTMNSMTTSPSFTPTSISSTVDYTAVTTDTENEENAKSDQSLLVKILSAEEMRKMKTTLVPRPSSTIAPRTTTVSSLTTDPIFSHYKQPAKPIRGPMYLIIQGHSKVKTYKPTVNKHGVPVENNEILENVTERQLSKLEQLIRENTKNGPVDTAVEKRKLEEKTRADKRVSSLHQESLMSLVENGLNGFTVSPSSSEVTEDERHANLVTNVEMN